MLFDVEGFLEEMDDEHQRGRDDAQADHECQDGLKKDHNPCNRPAPQFRENHAEGKVQTCHTADRPNRGPDQEGSPLLGCRVSHMHPPCVSVL